MTEEPTKDTPYVALVPPTPVLATAEPRRPVLVTWCARLLFLFAAVELCMAGWISIESDYVARYINSTVAEMYSLSITYAGLIGLSLAFTVFYLLHGVRLLQQRPGTPRKIISLLIARFVYVNGLLIFQRIVLHRFYSGILDLLLYIIVNVLVYSLTIFLLTRPSVREAFTVESIARPPADNR
ncbi:MAG: hypothetical protein BWY76_00791 [bacterium ADurb.Bin429]|nr:MAG: hypothetical protein BWY76_00791 [bacterium ADurb.Bin429]